MSTILERVRAILAPEYEVEAELGRGGMGMVFRARDTRLERVVAIKILRPELASAHAAERFKREAQLLAKLKHQNVVPVYDVNERDGIPYYVMAYLDGETLGQRLSRGALAPRRAVQIVRDVLSGLEAVHARGILHRDIKPDNILLEEERAILTDFGIAKSVSDGAAPLTTPGAVPGTMWVTNAAAGAEHGLAFRVFGSKGGLEWNQEHPNELRHRRLIVVFQPHRYSRLSALMHDFARSFEGADRVYILDVYSAGEENTSGVSAADLAHQVPNGLYVGDFQTAKEALENIVGPDDLVLLMGAGDIKKLGDELAHKV